MKRRPLLTLFILLFFLSFNSGIFAQQARVNQKQIDRKRIQQEKKARKTYEMDLKRHLKSQSKETKVMMRESRRKAKKLTPLKN